MADATTNIPEPPPITIADTWVHDVLINYGLNDTAVQSIAYSTIFILVLCVAVITTLVVRRALNIALRELEKRSRHSWTIALQKTGVLHKISWFVPIIIVSFTLDIIFSSDAPVYILSKRLIMSACVLVAVLSITAILSSLNEIRTLVNREHSQLLRSYTDVGRILAYVIGFIFVISIFTGKSPWGVISVLGGLTAITLLIFKDAILGFVASIQLNTMDLVKLGDWISMPQYEADGDVIEISIHSVKVQNWDKTITSIPTYSLVSNSFKNWRGMTESRGRRIKRALYIDMESIRFCDEKLLERLSHVELLKKYLSEKEHSINQTNKALTTSETTVLLNGRRQTNIGIFRAYIQAYLHSNPNLHTTMTFLVRQLAPTAQGLPIEIYVFSNKQNWAEYEDIQSDIFDHLLPATTEFGLRLFQQPTGYDMHLMTQMRNNDN